MADAARNLGSDKSKPNMRWQHEQSGVRQYLFKCIARLILSLSHLRMLAT